MRSQAVGLASNRRDDAANGPYLVQCRVLTQEGDSMVRPGALFGVAAGGAVGGSARLGIELAMPAAESRVPWATLGVNVAGTFVLAVVAVLVFEAWTSRRDLRRFLGVGLLGSFTTFSTWMLEVHTLTADGHAVLALGYLLGSLTAGLAAASLGLLLGRGIAVRRHRARVAAEARTARG